MRNMIMSVLAAGSLFISASSASAKNPTWAIIQTGDAKLVAFVDRDLIASDGGATVVLSGTPSASVSEVTVDVELLYAANGNSSDERKIIRHTRKTIEVDHNNHEITIAVGEHGRALDAYSVLVRVVEPGQEADQDTSMIKTNGSTHQAILALGRR